MLPQSLDWQYARDPTNGWEVAHWSGSKVPTSDIHFHPEVQFTFVSSGSRRFEIDGNEIRVDAGQYLLIPAGMPHRSLPDVEPGTSCVNVYIEPSQAPARVVSGELLGGEGESIAEVAARLGVSREAFTRRFTREVGMPPNAYRLIDRLNLGRQRLREGEAVARVAADLGFADQSHFGRHFRRAFGISPAAYREGMRGSQTF